MGRVLPVSTGLCVLLLGLVSTSGCQQAANPRIASTGLALALELRIDNEAVGEHYAELKEKISLEKGKLKFKELRGDEVETKTWCFMKYVVGESRWGIVPGTARAAMIDSGRSFSGQERKTGGGAEDPTTTPRLLEDELRRSRSEAREEAREAGEAREEAREAVAQREH